MDNRVAICNQAIGWLGGNLITSIDENSVEAKLCNANYAGLRDAVLEDYAWSFATKRRLLAPLSATPITYSHAFSEPSDSISIRKVSVDGRFRESERVEWVLEDSKILTSHDSIYVMYTYRQDDPTKFSPSFKQALAARIASDIAIPLTQSRQLQSDMWGLYQAKLRIGAKNDGKQGVQERLISSWLRKSR